ncbi:hypothetical protein PG993_015203 [Apiospora rasikravindrae]|uniref:Uncharacterized protein n=1 Tax=Apiospora rasikravindrae TaxID=990691 RepID=A0ABR1RR37_9PEZI
MLQLALWIYWLCLVLGNRANEMVHYHEPRPELRLAELDVQRQKPLVAGSGDWLGNPSHSAILTARMRCGLGVHPRRLGVIPLGGNAPVYVLDITHQANRMPVSPLRPTAQPFVSGMSQKQQQQQQQPPGSAQAAHTPPMPDHSHDGPVPAPYQP